MVRVVGKEGTHVYITCIYIAFSLNMYVRLSWMLPTRYYQQNIINKILFVVLVDLQQAMGLVIRWHHYFFQYVWGNL